MARSSGTPILRSKKRSRSRATPWGGIISGGAEGTARGKAFKVVFMRIAGTGLDTADTYQSPWLGEKGGGEVKLGGDGSYVVGIQGRSAADVDAFGLIQFGR